MRFALLACIVLALAVSARGDDLHARVGVVCLNALDSPHATWPNLDAWFEQFFAFELKRSGHEMRSPKQVAEVANAVRTELRVFDAHTGLRNAIAHEDVESAIASALAEKLGCTSQLKPAIELVRTNWRGGIASWDGTARWMGGGWDAYGTIGALTARIEFFDAKHTLIYRGYGGIRTTSHLEGGGFFEGPEFRGVEEGKLLGSVIWNTDGFRRAFGPLASLLTDEEVECVRVVHEKQLNERRAKKNKAPVSISRDEALAWLQPRTTFGEGWGMAKGELGVDPTAGATLADCVLKEFDYVPVEKDATEEAKDGAVEGEAPDKSEPEQQSQPEGEDAGAQDATNEGAPPSGAP